MSIIPSLRGTAAPKTMVAYPGLSEANVDETVERKPGHGHLLTNLLPDLRKTPFNGGLCQC